MDRRDYYRHRATLMTSGEVTFTKPEETIQFFAMLISEVHKKALQLRRGRATTIAERQDLDARLVNESDLAGRYVEFFLKEKLPDHTKLSYILARKLKQPEPVLEFDVHNHTEMYEYVLKRLGRTGDVPVEDAFANFATSPQYDHFEIVGVLKVKYEART